MFSEVGNVGTFYRSVSENLLSGKDAVSMLVEPHVRSDVVYIRLTQFENNTV